MKKTTLLLVLNFAVASLFAQQVISDGENTGVNWWQAGSTAVEYVDWHPKTGNPSAKAMTIWISPNSDVWSGGGLGGLNINVSTYNKISVLVFKNVAGTVRLELQDGGPNRFVSANYTTPGAWQKLEFAIPAGMGNITTLLIAPFIDYPLATIVGEQSRCFWDDVIAFNDTNTGFSNPSEMSNRVITKTEIYSLTGNLIETLNGDLKITNSILSKGLYLVKKQDNTGFETCVKVAVN